MGGIEGRTGVEEPDYSHRDINHLASPAVISVNLQLI